eukprot:scaffold97998_cov18-Tisochrysis_lutea.AAC.1
MTANLHSSVLGTLAHNAAAPRAAQSSDRLCFHCPVLTANTNVPICSQISVALTLTDVQASAGTHRQFVRVIFVDAAQQVEVLQPYSGNPGYMRGLPLLVRDFSRELMQHPMMDDPASGGRLIENPNSDKVAVQRFVRGITAPQISARLGRKEKKKEKKRNEKEDWTDMKAACI